MIEPERWRRANRALIAKAIGEFAYEELLDPEPLGKKAYRLPLSSGVCYEFNAHAGAWTWLNVDPRSLCREGGPAVDAIQFLLDIQTELDVGDLALGELIREINNTLYSELRRRRRLENVDAGTLATMPGPRQETFYDAHPKFIANKGRVGWGERALSRYAPEAANPFQLRWLAVHEDHAQQRLAPETSEQALLKACLDEGARRELTQRMQEAAVSPQAYRLLPVHPWQYQRFIRSQYTQTLAEEALVDLGRLGDRYLAQQSIRTLSNVSRPEQANVKVSLTILNTSCYRGISGEHLEVGVALSCWLAEQAGEDDVLASRNLQVLRQRGAMHVPHPHHAGLDEGPYRFQEMLGAVWRESPQPGLGTNEQAVLLAALMQTDAEGRALVAEHVERSSLGAEEWLCELFDAVTVPLYHLMAAYGIGLVAHGQNVGLVLCDHRPTRALLKDVHGDLRLVDRTFPQMQAIPAPARRSLERLPPEHLLQDLITGHLVTTLRFVSPLVENQLDVSEARFYELLADTLRSYQQAHPELADRFALFDLFKDPMDKVLVNRVRLQSGFGQGANRPKPTFGSPIPNPLAGGDTR